jgi:hypothetical protein
VKFREAAGGLNGAAAIGKRLVSVPDEGNCALNGWTRGFRIAGLQKMWKICCACLSASRHTSRGAE